MNLHERLKEERERIGLSQTAFAALAAWADAGLDVLYVVTGQRSQPVPPAQELPRQEQEWLALYRNSSEEVRAALKAAGNELTKPAKARGKAA